MTLKIDERALMKRLERKLDDDRLRQGVQTLAGDRFFLAHFLASVSQGEGMGENANAVGTMYQPLEGAGHEELAARIADLERQASDARRHRKQTIDAAQALFPEYFDRGRYRYEAGLPGALYYRTALAANRARLKERDRYTRLSFYLTTSFGYEIMVAMLYRLVADAVRVSSQFGEVRGRVARLLEGILDQETAHLGIPDQHNALLETPRRGLSERSCAMLDALEELEAEDYEAMAVLCVDQMVVLTGGWADKRRARAEIEASAAA